MTTHLEHALEPAAVHSIKIQHVIQHLGHHAQTPFERTELDLLRLRDRAVCFHVLHREQRRVQRYADLVKHVRREPPFAVGRLALVHLRFLRRAELDLELVAKGV